MMSSLPQVNPYKQKNLVFKFKGFKFKFSDCSLFFPHNRLYMLCPINPTQPHTVHVNSFKPLWINHPLLHKKLPPNLAAEDPKYALCHTVSESQESSSDLAGWFQFRISRGCSHPKARLGLVSVLPSSLPWTLARGPSNFLVT